MDSLGKNFDEVYQEALSRWGAFPEVAGIDIGFLNLGERGAERICIRIHSRIDTEVLAQKLSAPPDLAGVPVEIVRGSYRMEACPSPNPRRQRRDPIQPGISTGPTITGPGTLGIFVQDNQTKKPALLSAAHVLAGCPPGGGAPRIFQPAPDDCGSPNANRIAKLERWILGPDGDAAIAFLNDSRGINRAQFGSLVVVQKERMAQLGEIVEKSGLATGVTRGRIDGIGTYYLECGGRIGIEGFRIAPEDGADPNKELTFRGDSGAVWYAVTSKEGLGLHLAGEEQDDPQEYAIACHLPRVLSALNVTLL